MSIHKTVPSFNKTLTFTNYNRSRKMNEFYAYLKIKKVISRANSDYETAKLAILNKDLDFFKEYYNQDIALASILEKKISIYVLENIGFREFGRSTVDGFELAYGRKPAYAHATAGEGVIGSSSYCRR